MMKPKKLITSHIYQSRRKIILNRILNNLINELNIISLYYTLLYFMKPKYMFEIDNIFDIVIFNNNLNLNSFTS